MAAEIYRPAEHGLVLIRQEMPDELQSILAYWKKYVTTADRAFHGSVNRFDQADPGAGRGLVMYSRILWAFSSSFEITQCAADLQVAANAYHYILEYFHDKQSDGYYWSVHASGEPLQTRKQVYGQAFCLYGMAAYCRQVNDPDLVGRAAALFRLIESRAHDLLNDGYTEAFERDWSPAADMRLSEKDDAGSKTMNTHLHIVEAYAELYRVWPDPLLKERIAGLLDLFARYFIDPLTGATQLFFSADWKAGSMLRSYGHDIEASWLLLYCAEIIDDKERIAKYTALSALMLGAAEQGLDADGALWYESDPATGKWIMEKHWWPQAEAMVAYMNAWEMTGDEKYSGRLVAAWSFIKKYLRDPGSGEWFWGVHEDYSVIEKEKAGFWKCPYHNTRACLEIIRRSGTIKLTHD